MKVAMLGWEFPPFMAGGLGTHCLGLTRDLARAGIHVDFYMPRMDTARGPVSAHHHHLRITEVDAAPGLGPYEAQGSGTGSGGGYGRDFNASVHTYNQRLVDAFHSTDADVIHCHDWITVPAALELQKRTKIPLVFTVHSTEFDRSAGLSPQHWIEDIERAGVQKADRVVAVSGYTKGLVERLYNADPERVVAIHNGVDLDRFQSVKPRDYTVKRDTVLYLSRLCRQKGPLFFLDAARRVLKVRPQTRFIIGGTGDMLGECIEYALEHNLGDSIHFTGFVPDDELADFYLHNEIYVLPSVSEPFGISVLEAMASGLPTIVTRTSGVGEALDHVLRAEYWDTEEMADLMLRLLESRELREEMGRNGGQEASTFTWETTCRKTIDAYRSVIRPRWIQPTP